MDRHGQSSVGQAQPLIRHRQRVVEVSTSTNATTSGRSVTLTIAGESHTVTQAAHVFGQPDGGAGRRRGGTVSVSVGANSCNWTS